MGYVLSAGGDGPGAADGVERGLRDGGADVQQAVNADWIGDEQSCLRRRCHGAGHTDTQVAMANAGPVHVGGFASFVNFNISFRQIGGVTGVM